MNHNRSEIQSLREHWEVILPEVNAPTDNGFAHFLKIAGGDPTVILYAFTATARKLKWVANARGERMSRKGVFRFCGTVILAETKRRATPNLLPERSFCFTERTA